MPRRLSLEAMAGATIDPLTAAQLTERERRTLARFARRTGHPESDLAATGSLRRRRGANPTETAIGAIYLRATVNR
jgi:hypothetical protein